MSFFIAVNKKTITLQAEYIIDNVSEEPVSKKEIETLAFMLAERFSQLSCDTLLLQGLSNTLTLAILLAAWHVGIKVALLRADAFLPYFEKSKILLGNHLHVFYDAINDEVLATNETHSFTFEAWIENAPTQDVSPHPFNWDDHTVSLIFFTSGSTGHPKGVCHSLPSLIRSANTFKEYFDITPRDHIVSFAELHTNTGLRTLCLALLDNISVLFPRKHKGTLSHELMALKNATLLICGPYMLEVLLCLEIPLKPLLHPELKILSLGSHLPLKIIEQMYKRHQITVLNFYGLTETFGFALADQVRNTTDYLPPPCTQVKIELIPTTYDNNLFYLEISSPNLFLSYLGESPQKKLTFNTGDLVYRDEYGGLKFMGRASHAAKSTNGEWIFPLALETWIRTQPDVQDVIVKVNPPLSTESLLSIFITTEKDFANFTTALTQKILVSFGLDYHSMSWHLANIKRSVEGKIESIMLST